MLLRSKAARRDPWLVGLRSRKPCLIVAVALAKKKEGTVHVSPVERSNGTPRGGGSPSPPPFGR